MIKLFVSISMTSSTQAHKPDDLAKPVLVLKQQVLTGMIKRKEPTTSNLDIILEIQSIDTSNL